jgi:ubiquinone/menaquinone biosynthesis C-methylase UbiE
MLAEDCGHPSAHFQESPHLIKSEPMMNNPLPPVDTPNDFDIYENVDYRHYWRSLSRQKLDELERSILDELLPTHGHAIVDLGCGYGRLFSQYAGRFQHVVLFDGSESLLRQAQADFKEKAFYVLGDIEHLPFRAAAFDTALLVRVFHHLNHPEEVVSAIRRLLCGNGLFIMNYSNKRNALQIIKFLFMMTRHNPFTPETLKAEANFFHHHPASITRLMAGAGFQSLVHRGAGVFDKIAPLLGPIHRFAPTGKRLAPFLGKTALAPWVFCKAELSDHIPRQTFEKNSDLLACPVCHNELSQKDAAFCCTHCALEYPIRHGIVDMRMINR